VLTMIGFIYRCFESRAHFGKAIRKTERSIYF